MDDGDSLEISTLRSLRTLTAEEEVLANDARAHIAKTIENNLVRVSDNLLFILYFLINIFYMEFMSYILFQLMAVISARSDRKPRQEDEDEDVASITPNPNVLPQVAQILGAIFSGSLNITRVVDQTFGLVPNIVRNQVGGLVKLLTGESMDTTAATTVAPNAAAAGPPSVVIIAGPPAPPANTEAPVVQTTNEAVVVEVKKVETTTPPLPPAVELTQVPAQPGNGTSKNKYRLRNRTKVPSTTKRSLLEDDEIEKLEEDIRRAAREYEPYMRNKEPRVLAPIFQTVFGRVDFNMTDVARAVPSIFKGAHQAFVILNNLGVLDVNDFLDELGMPPLKGTVEAVEDEEEEEEE